MIPGVKTLHTYEPKEFIGSGPAEQFLKRNCTIEQGQDLIRGTLIGLIPTVPTKFGAYDNSAVASATTPSESSANTGKGSISAVAVQDDHTISQDWTLTCTTTGGTGSGKFKLVGSVSGEVAAAGAITVGTEFSWPATADYQVKFTISDGTPDWTQGDIITFSTVRAEALEAEGILAQEVDAEDSDALATYFTRGNFVIANLTGYDSNAVADLNGRVVQGELQI